MKKLISLVISLGMLFSMSANVFAYADDTDMKISGTTSNRTAAESSEITIMNFSKSISSEELQEIVHGTDACMVFEDGTVVPVAYVVTIEDVATPRNMAESQNTYKVTVSADVSEDKMDNDAGVMNGNVTASATLELLWTDVPGVNNVIKRIKGTLTLHKGTVEVATVRYGDTWVTPLQWIPIDVTGMSSFTYFPNVTTIAPGTGYTIIFEEAVFSLYLRASSFILQ